MYFIQDKLFPLMVLACGSTASTTEAAKTLHCQSALQLKSEKKEKENGNLEKLKTTPKKRHIFLVFNRTEKKAKESQIMQP